MSSRTLEVAFALTLIAAPAAAQPQPMQELSEEQRAGLDEERATWTSAPA